MNILHLGTYASYGGAAVATSRLHRGLTGQGVNSRILAAHVGTDEPGVRGVAGGRILRTWRECSLALEGAVQRALYGRPEYPAYVSFSWVPSPVHKRLNVFVRNVLHLHWIGQGFIPPYALARLNGPVVWTMHDTWPFTGGCHWLNGCERYRESCGQCPELCSAKSYDLSRLHWNLKHRAIARLKPTLVAPSRAYAELASQSGMLAGCRVEHIPNGIDTRIFRPIDKEAARGLLGLPQERPILLFGAVGGTIDHNKGFDLLIEALQHTVEKNPSDPLCLIFGASGGIIGGLPYAARFLGWLHDDVSLALAYSAADVFVCPSRQENLPNTIMEALACGTPVVGFSVGGIPDMVEHGVTGWLASPHDSAELGEGISLLLGNVELRQRMGASGREKIEREFALDLITTRYIALYREILGKGAA